MADKINLSDGMFLRQERHSAPWELWADEEHLLITQDGQPFVFWSLPQALAWMQVHYPAQGLALRRYFDVAGDGTVWRRTVR